MNDHDIDRTLADWFDTDALASAPADGLDRALAGVRRRRPRSAWLAGSGSHWGWAAPRDRSIAGDREFPQVRLRWSTALGVAVLLGMLLGAAILVGAQFLKAPPLPAPHLGHLAYAFDGDVFVADWDGRNPIKIADGLPGGKSGCGLAGYSAEEPMWSPDGRHLAFRSARSQVDCSRPEADTIPTVLISDPSGKGVTEVPGVGWQVAWSPDSSRFATWLDLYPMTSIGVYGLDGVRQARLSIPDGKGPHGDYDPVWSDDGQSLLIPLGDWDVLTDSGSGVSAVWELPIDGRTPRPLPDDDPRSDWGRTRSPDGARVAYVVPRPTGGETGTLVVAAADGSEPRELFSDATIPWMPLTWSPTSDRIAFVAGGTTSQELQSDGTYSDVLDASTMDLRLVDVASGSVTTLVPAGTGDALSIIEFSPEGDRILYSRFAPDGTTQSIWSVNADGSEALALVSAAQRGPLAAAWQSVLADPSQTAP